jgi:H+/Cl- antiporter ClcA
VTTAFVIEVARPKGRRFQEALFACLLSSSVAFAVYYPIAGSTFVGLYRLPAYKYEDWQLLAAVPLGLVAGVLALIMVVVTGVMMKLTLPLARWTILRATIGGVLFGLVGVALPLTLFTGTDQLDTVIRDGTTLGAGLLIAVVFAKMLTFALCQATGFIGGPVLVSLFVGGTAGTAAHALIPGLPLGLAFATMFAAYPGSLVAAPFSVILITALTTEVGALQLAPVAIAVLTGYLAISGAGTLMDLAKAARARKAARPVAHAKA